MDMCVSLCKSIIKDFATSVLKSVFNIPCNIAADKLKKRGDVTDEKLRNVLVENLYDIKTKIDALARKDLLTSYSFLEEGTVALNFELDETKDEQTSKDEANADQHGESKTIEMTTRNESKSDFLNKAVQLSAAIQKLNNTSNARLAKATECFKAAREEATRAFCNEALSLPDRIMATRLRVLSKILECLQDTKAAVAGCMLFLKGLHNLPAIGEIFSTYFKGGIKSRVFKDSRLEIVKSVISLNFGISKFIARFSSELHDVTNWPRIPLPTKAQLIHPLVIDPFTVKEIFDKEELPENQLTLDTAGFGLNYVINSKREVLWADEDATCINIVNRSGDMKRFCELRQATANPKGDNQYPVALAIDHDDNVFLIICFRDRISEEYVHVLFVYDHTGKKTHEHVLDLLPCISALNLCVVDNDIFIHKNFDDFIHICDSKGNLKSRLPLEQNSSYHSGDFISMECVTDDRDIVTCTDENVLVYTKEGKLRRMIKVSEMIKKRDEIKAARYNKVTSKIEVLVGKKSSFETRSYCILSFSESGEVDSRLHLPVKEMPEETLRETLEKNLKEETRVNTPIWIAGVGTTLGELFKKSLVQSLAITLAEFLGETQTSQRWEKTLTESMARSLAQILEKEMELKTRTAGMTGRLIQSGKPKKNLRGTLVETLTVIGTLTGRRATQAEMLVHETQSGIVRMADMLVQEPVTSVMFDHVQNPVTTLIEYSYQDPMERKVATTLAAVLQGECPVSTPEGLFLFSLKPYPSCRFLQHPAGPIALLKKNVKKTSIIFL